MLLDWRDFWGVGSGGGEEWGEGGEGCGAGGGDVVWSWWGIYRYCRMSW
jgi:hypothetical protein